MMYVIRGTDARRAEDFAFVVEAKSQEAAECWALKREVPVEFIGPAEESDIAEARRTNHLWKCSPGPKYTCFGQPVRAKQLACLMIAGVLTMGLIVSRTTRPARSSTVAVQRG
jgi:hypothetical protein